MMKAGSERKPEDLRGADQAVCFGYHSALFRPAQEHLGAGAWKAVGTSVGAHYREAFRSRSNAEFISKIEGGLQELEESVYWMELLQDSGTATADGLASLREEADQLTRILVTCVKKVKP